MQIKIEDLCTKVINTEQEICEDVARKLVNIFGYPADYLVRNYEQGEKKEFVVNGVVCAVLKKRTGDILSGDYTVEYRVSTVPYEQLKELAGLE